MLGRENRRAERKAGRQACWLVGKEMGTGGAAPHYDRHHDADRLSGEGRRQAEKQGRET